MKYKLHSNLSIQKLFERYYPSAQLDNGDKLAIFRDKYDKIFTIDWIQNESDADVYLQQNPDEGDFLGFIIYTTDNLTINQYIMENL